MWKKEKLESEWWNEKIMELIQKERKAYGPLLLNGSEDVMEVYTKGQLYYEMSINEAEEKS